MSPMTTSFKSSKTEPRMGTKSSGTLATCNTWCQGSKGSKGSKGWKETTQGGEHLFDPLETMPSLLDSTLVSPWSSFRFNQHVRVLKISGPTCRFDIWTLSIYYYILFPEILSTSLVVLWPTVIHPPPFVEPTWAGKARKMCRPRWSISKGWSWYQVKNLRCKAQPGSRNHLTRHSTQKIYLRAIGQLMAGYCCQMCMYFIALCIYMYIYICVCVLIYPSYVLLDILYSHMHPYAICSMVLEYLPTFAQTKSPSHVGIPYMEHMGIGIQSGASGYDG